MLLSSRPLSLFCWVLIPILAGGCQSPGARTPASSPGAAKPNFGPPMQDVRTESTIQAMENDYIAAKNSRPTHQAEANAAAEKKKKEQAQKPSEEKAPATTPESGGKH